MRIKSSNILIFGLLLEGVGHIMVIQNGYWNDFVWLISIPSLIILITVYRHIKNKEIKNRVKRIKNYADI